LKMLSNWIERICIFHSYSS